MSLVLGRVDRSGVRLICDSQITDPSQLRSNLIPGRLKLVTLHSNLCVGYVGQPNVAIDAIREAVPIADFADIVEFLFKCHRSKGEAADFLVASLDPTSLAKIADGQVYQEGPQHWIGDPNAVHVFEKHYSQAPDPKSGEPEDIVTGKVLQAFDNTVADPQAPTVGGIVFSVVPTRKGLLYAPAARAFFSSQTIPSGIETPLRFGTAVEGAYAYSIYVPESGVAVVGVYFLQGRCGLLYRPLVTDEALWITDVSQKDFPQRVRQVSGVAVRGVTFD